MAILPIFILGVACMLFEGVLGQDNDTSQNDDWLNDMTKPLNYSTNSPVSFDTNQARPINTSLPLKITYAIFETGILCNTGKIVTFTSEVSKSETTVSQGVFKEDVYIFDSVEYYWNNDPHQWFGATIDGKSTPLQIAVIFINKKYGTKRSALRRRDGTVVVLIKVAVQGHLPSRGFRDFQSALQGITNAGDCVELRLGQAFSFFTIFNIPSYYLYPGSNYVELEPETEQTYSASIVVFPPDQLESISIDEFEYFLRLLNSNQSPDDGSLSSYELGDRPLYQVAGFETETKY